MKKFPGWSSVVVVFITILIFSGCATSPGSLPDQAGLPASGSAAAPPVLSTSESAAAPGTATREIGPDWQFGKDSIRGDMLVMLKSELTDKIWQQSFWTYNLQTGEEKKLLDLPNSRQLNSAPSMFGEKVVWASVDAAENMQNIPHYPASVNWEVFLLDTKTGEITQLTHEPRGQLFPVISGDTVVWLDARNQDASCSQASFDIYTYDLKTKQESRITTRPTVEAASSVLSLSGDLLVWPDSRHADQNTTDRPQNTALYNNEIYLYDYKTKQEKRVTDSPLNDHYPQIDGGSIVWLRQEDSQNADVFMYDLADGREVQVSQSNYAKGAPSISNGRIAWMDARISEGWTLTGTGKVDQMGVLRYAGAEIFLYDMKTGNETLIASARPEDNGGRWTVWGLPVLSGNYLFYAPQGLATPKQYLTVLPEN